MVYKNIDDSLYFFEYNCIKFYFSSSLYLEKFKQNYVKTIKEETLKLRLKYKCNFIGDEMILIMLYKKIEKRGFRIYYKTKRLQENLCINSFIDILNY